MIDPTSPTCARCGGLRRPWLRRNRRHAGLFMLKACCCGPYCQPYVDVTLAGVDAALCTYCRPVLGAWIKLVDLTIDGTYQVPIVGLPTSGDCTYRLVLEGSFATENRWSGSGCTGTLETSEITKIVISITIDHDGNYDPYGTGPFGQDYIVGARVDVASWPEGGSLTNWILWRNVALAGTGHFVGETMPPDSGVACAAPHATNGGTMLVEWPTP